MAKFCSHCGQPIEGSFGFCPSCGQALTPPAPQETAQPTYSPAHPTQVPAQPTYTPAQPTQVPPPPVQGTVMPVQAIIPPEESKKKGKAGTVVLVVIIVLLFLALIGGVIYWLFFMPKEEAPAQPSDGGEDISLNSTVGTLSGQILSAKDRETAIGGATIKVFQNGKECLTDNANETGNYDISLGSGDYYIQIQSEGYMDFHSYATIVGDVKTYMESFLMIKKSSASSGGASGTLSSASSGAPLSGVELSVHKDWNNTSPSTAPIATTTTDSDGDYHFDLPLGNYTVIANKPGYIQDHFNIVVQEGETNEQNGVIQPTVEGSDSQYLITLTWDSYPTDLDSHMEGTLKNGESFHIDFHYSESRDYDAGYDVLDPLLDGDTYVCRLDCDDTESFGPEHITLTPTTDKPYYYYIYNYSEDGLLSLSGAKVTIHKNNKLIATYNVPTDLDDNVYWNVFAVKNGEIIPRNTLTNDAETAYAD